MSLRLAWCTDIHLDFLEDAGIERLCEDILGKNPDAVLLGGDISVAPRLEEHLSFLEMRLRQPIYFVLGNHDFYGSSIDRVRAGVRRLCRASQWLRWLPDEGVIELSAKTALIGHDGWGDGRLGAGSGSRVLLTDFYAIEDLTGLEDRDRFARLAELGDEAAAHFRRALPEALDRFDRVVLLTHVPPFRESCWHEGRISSDDFLPHFTCKAVGDTLREVMESRRDRELMVLCGHTHGRGEVEILPNLKVVTGGAEYGKPEVQRLIEIQ